MSKVVIEKIKCDLCSKIIKEEDTLNVYYPTIVVPEDNAKPYIQNVEIDVCRDCGEKVLKVYRKDTSKKLLIRESEKNGDTQRS